MKTYPKGPFLGINNRLPDFALRKTVRNNDSAGDYLRQAENVDITNSGNIKRRKAAVLLQALTNPHSLYMDSATTGYIVMSSVMYRITLPSYTQTMFKMLSVNDPVSFLPYAGSLYWSNGTDSGRIEGGLNFPMALPTPATPAVVNIAGTMDAGWYQVTIAHYNNTTGEEGGVAPSQNYQLSAPGALRVTIPSAVTGGTHVNVYVSTVDGSIPMLQTTVPAGAGVADITVISTSGREAVQRYETPLPAGTLFMHNGALCSFRGSNVYRGTPYRPGYCILTEARIPFPAEVTNAASAQKGVYFTTAYTDEKNPGTTYWFPGEDLKDVGAIVDVLPYGAVKGTSFKYKHKIDNQAVDHVGWFGTQGLVIGDTSGVVTCSMAENVDVVAPLTGVSAIFSDRGYIRVVSCGYVQNLENGAVTTYTGYDFTSIAGNYATKVDGIYDLNASGDTAYVVDFGKQNFNTENFKHLPATYLGVNSEVPMTMRVQAPDDVDYSYNARSSGTDNRIQRVDPGKGLRANWFNLSLVGTSDFTLAAISFAPLASTRRI